MFQEDLYTHNDTMGLEDQRAGQAKCWISQRTGQAKCRISQRAEQIIGEQKQYSAPVQYNTRLTIQQFHNTSLPRTSRSPVVVLACSAPRTRAPKTFLHTGDSTIGCVRRRPAGAGCTRGEAAAAS
jgi:hypothetical protein